MFEWLDRWYGNKWQLYLQTTKVTFLSPGKANWQINRKLGTVNTADLSVKNNTAFTVMKNIFQMFRKRFSSSSVVSYSNRIELKYYRISI